MVYPFQLLVRSNGNDFYLILIISFLIKYTYIYIYRNMYFNKSYAFFNLLYKI